MGTNYYLYGPRLRGGGSEEDEEPLHIGKKTSGSPASADCCAIK